MKKVLETISKTFCSIFFIAFIMLCVMKNFSATDWCYTMFGVMLISSVIAILTYTGGN